MGKKETVDEIEGVILEKKKETIDPVVYEEVIMTYTVIYRPSGHQLYELA